jgi:plastocyanin
MPPAPRAVTAGCLVAVAGLSTACLSSQSPINRRPHLGSTTATTSANGIQHVTVTADDTYRFFPSTITVHPGKVQITLKNTGSGAPHNWGLDAFGTADLTPDIPGGQSTSVTFTTPAPGRYSFSCTIHAKQGQTGVLIVLPD